MNSNDLAQTTDVNQEKSTTDWTKLNLEEHITQLEKLIKTDNPKAIRAEVEEGKRSFETLVAKDREEKLAQFEKDKEEDETFEYQNIFNPRFHQVQKDFRHRLKNYNLEQQAKQKKNSHEAKLIIESIQNLHESTLKFGEKLNIFNEAKDKWAQLGDLDPENRNTLRNNFKLQLDNFYGFLRQRNEYSDMSFSKNKTEKEKLIQHAQDLLHEDNPSKALQGFNRLYQMWRELGSAGKEFNDQLWEEFIQIKNQLNEKLKSYREEMRNETAENDKKRAEIIELIANVNTQEFTKHQHWVDMTQNINQLIDLFSSLSSVFSNQNEALWAKLKEARKQYNKSKNNFYRSLKGELQDNLKRKKELIEEAKQHVDSTDHKKATPLFKRLQKDWKSIGQVPRHESDKVWQEFSSICNAYFDKIKQKTAQIKEKSNESIRQYSEIIASVQDIEFNTDKLSEQLGELWAKWSAVPKIHSAEIAKLLRSFETRLQEQVTHQTQLSETEYRALAMEIELNQAKSDPDTLYRHLSNLRKEIEQNASELHQLENNLGFFENPETNPLTQDLVKTIAGLKDKLNGLNSKKQYINSLLRKLTKETEQE